MTEYTKFYYNKKDNYNDLTLFEERNRAIENINELSSPYKNCIKWDTVYNGNYPSNYDSSELGDHNYCRNPTNDNKGDWCHIDTDQNNKKYCYNNGSLYKSNILKNKRIKYYDTSNRIILDYKNKNNDLTNLIDNNNLLSEQIIECNNYVSGEELLINNTKSDTYNLETTIIPGLNQDKEDTIIIKNKKIEEIQTCENNITIEENKELECESNTAIINNDIIEEENEITRVSNLIDNLKLDLLSLEQTNEKLNILDTDLNKTKNEYNSILGNNIIESFTNINNNDNKYLYIYILTFIILIICINK